MANGLPYRNHILAHLASADFALLEPNLEPTDLPLRKILEPRGIFSI